MRNIFITFCTQLRETSFAIGKTDTPRQTSAGSHNNPMIWTHIFDLFAKLVCIALAILMFVLESHQPRQNADLVILAFSFVAGGVLWWVALRPLSSWLHARLRLGTSLSWDQARRASMLFSPVRFHDLLQWHPMWEVRQLPAEARTAAIEAGLSQLLAQREAKAAHWRAAPVVSHVFRWLRWGGVAALVVVPLGNLPPASWVSEFQAARFDGACYPMLTFVILAIPAAGCLALLESMLGPRSVTLVSNPAQPDDSPALVASALTSPAPAIPFPVEKGTVVDPSDHSRFAPPPGLISPRRD